MKSKIPSEEVAVKMNEWYKLIRAFEADKAEALKRRFNMNSKIWKKIRIYCCIFH